MSIWTPIDQVFQKQRVIDSKALRLGIHHPSEKVWEYVLAPQAQQQCESSFRRRSCRLLTNLAARSAEIAFADLLWMKTVQRRDHAIARVLPCVAARQVWGDERKDVVTCCRSSTTRPSQSRHHSSVVAILEQVSKKRLRAIFRLGKRLCQAGTFAFLTPLLEAVGLGLSRFRIIDSSFGSTATSFH